MFGAGVRVAHRTQLLITYICWIKQTAVASNIGTGTQKNNVDYSLVEEDKTIYYHHPTQIRLHYAGWKEKWTAYRFIKDVYDKFRPMHLKRICSAIDMLPP